MIRHPSIELDKLLQSPICLIELLVMSRTIVVTTVVLRNMIGIKSLTHCVFSARHKVVMCGMFCQNEVNF